jgi:predicted RNA-binding protein with PUA-like domain
MNYWLVKSEPFKYSWDQFVKDGRTFWDGVRNYQARNNLRAMEKGDRVLFYHSNEGMEIVGVAEVARTAYQDPTAEDANWVVVDLKPVKALKNPVSLAVMKQTEGLKEISLVRQSRLSVCPIRQEEYRQILDMSKK